MSGSELNPTGSRSVSNWQMSKFLGILLYILVVGNPPFRGELQICTGKLRFPRNVSSECRALIRRCLCPTAESRISLEELQQHAWISCKTTTSFFTNFEAEWRRRKRDSLKSDCHRGELSDDDDDDEDCSYRTEAGAEPGPLTIPMICAALVTQRSPTLSSFVEHHQNNNNNNNSPSSVVEESAVLDEYDERPKHESAEMCSSFPSLLSSETETGFETAPEYDDWRYEGGRLGFSSLSRCCTSAGDDLLDGCAFVQQNFIYAQQKCTDDDNDDDDDQQQRKTSVANSLPSFGHPIHRVGFRATQSDRGSARSSSSESKGRRSNSFTSDDSFTSSTTYFSANSHNIPLPEWSSTSSSCVVGGVCLSNSNSNIERLNDDEDELTLRVEIPRQIVLKEERRRSAVSAKDEEEDEWDDDTIRLDIPNSCVAEKCQNNVTKKRGDESPSASSSLSPVIEQHQQMNKWEIEKQHLTPHIMKQLFKPDDGLVGVGDGQQQGNYYSARRKGGDRYRRRKGTHMLLLDGVGRPFDRRRRRLTSPPQQLNMFSFVNNM
ncbi:hypothetical protein GPALN_002102 [Globodera pallida]|nr:hypothetical protein GPALN_002102 [Globodera pallida]